MTLPHAELRERACAANLALVEAGLVVLSFGNASEVDREAGVLAIKPSGVPYDELTAESMVCVSLDDGSVVDGTLRPSSDTPTHLVLCRSFDAIGGVVHTHSPAATSWAQAGLPVPALGTTHADHFHGPVPVTRQLRTTEISGDYEHETGNVIVETFAHKDPLDVPAVLVASHGPFTWGRDAAQAVVNAVALELAASMALHAIALRPDVAPIGPALLDRHFFRKHGADAYYGQRS